MKSLKINKLANCCLNESEMNKINGGYVWVHDVKQENGRTIITICGCGCYYANQGGSTTNDNANANLAQGLASPQK